MVDQLLYAVKYCIEDGNATGAYVYARMLAHHVHCCEVADDWREDV